MEVLFGELTGEDPLVDLTMAEAMLRQAAAGEIEHAVRLYRPRAPMAVFGRREVHLPGFPAACEVARQAGFRPAVRVTGGRAVAYTTDALVLDIVRARSTEPDDPIGRFETYGGLLAAAFGAFGVEAQLGAVPGEYCPGAHSINVRAAAKLVGTSQRVVRGAWLFSALVVIGDRERVSEALAGIYTALGQPLDPASVGSLAEEAPGLRPEQLERVILDRLTGGEATRRWVGPELLGQARALASTG